MNKRVVIVSATKKSKEDFWKDAYLAKALKKIGRKTSEISSEIFYRNSRGLGTVYNEVLRNKKYVNDIILFVHDDVLIEDAFFREKINEAIQRFNVVGIAGNKKPKKGSLQWCDWGPDLCGAVAHPFEDMIYVTVYGPSPSECKLIDGLFIAVDMSAISQSNVFFDDKFRFHFYDLDFCLSCIKNGLRIGTWPIWAVHYGKGDSPGWEEESVRFGQKWQGQWPI